LKQAFEKFQEIDFEKKSQKEEIKKRLFYVPLNVDEIIESKEASLLFYNFVSDCYGKNYVDCFIELKSFSHDNSNDWVSKKEKAILIMEQFCKPDSLQNCIFNPEIREKIITKDKPSSNWFMELYNFIHSILKDEYYPRFINTIIWRDYVNSIYKKGKDCKFNEVYRIERTLKKETSLSEESEIYLVKNIITNEPFVAKKCIISDQKSKTDSVKVNLNYFDEVS
jgi:hypothetical protein